MTEHSQRIHLGHRGVRLAAVTAALIGASLMLAAAPAGAKVVIGTPRLVVAGGWCIYFSCPRTTTQAIPYDHEYVIAASTFPAGATGTVYYSISRLHGYRYSVSTSIAPAVSVYLAGVSGVAPDTCTVSQSVYRTFSTTSTYSVDALNTDHPTLTVTFTNTWRKGFGQKTRTP